MASERVSSETGGFGRVMTAERLAGLVEAGDAEGVRAGLAQRPELVTAAVERDGVAGWTLLHLAVRTGRGELVALLLSAGADPGARTEAGRTPLHVTLQYDGSARQALLAAGAEVDAEVAAYADDVAALTTHLDADPALSTTVRTGMAPLTWAAYGAAAGTARLLLDRGATADAAALRAAAEVDAVAVALIVLGAGADPGGADAESGRTALHLAAAHRWSTDNTAIARVLLDAGADVEAVTSDGATALDIARVGRARQSAEDTGTPVAFEAMIAVLQEFGARD